MRRFYRLQRAINHQEQRGFTLIELMIVVSIIGLLTTIVYPKYQDYIIKTNRSDMMAELHNIANRIHAQKLLHRSYLTDIPLTSVFNHTPSTDGSTVYPNDTKALYTVSIDNLNDDNSGINQSNWTITAAPIVGSKMSGDGNLSIRFNGKKCHHATTLKCSFDDGWQ